MKDTMCLEKTNTIKPLNLEIISTHLDRPVKVDIYRPYPPSMQEDPALLLVNDGQNMEELGLVSILENLYANGCSRPILVVAIHAGEKRKMEYGTAGVPDYLGRGNLAFAYTRFVFEELLPFIRRESGIPDFSEKWFAGFSLGGLSALDIVWAHPHEFTRVGVFSGSLWWRMIDQVDPAYDDDKHRIMHDLIRKGTYAPWLKFFLVTGTQDETNDRNNNGIIDSIDDTLGLIAELEKKGYQTPNDIVYLELPDGKHDIPTWSRAMPHFLNWAIGR